MCFIVSIPVTGRMSKALPGLPPWKLEEKKKSPYSSNSPTWASQQEGLCMNLWIMQDGRGGKHGLSGRFSIRSLLCWHKRAAAGQSPFCASQSTPAVLSRVFLFPRSLFEGFLALTFKQRTKLGHCFGGIWWNERPSLAHNFCIFTGGGRNLCGMFKDGKNSLCSKMCPQPRS